MNVGDKLAQFEILHLLGAGGMGEVYRARDTILDRDVALKILPAEWSADSDRLARFQREAKVLASLHHPNIASIFGLDESASHTYLIMELVEGQDLSEVLKQGPLPYEEAMDIARQIATGLEEAHAKGFIHRDLKPANIKLTPEGKVKILDFGLARALIDETVQAPTSEFSPTITAGMTKAGVILGTAAYMSPEQARGRPVDERADIWAFGCILLEMLTGRCFFAGDTFSDTLASILKTEPEWDDLPNNLPRGILRILRRCLAKDPHDRLHAVADARIELQDMDLEPATHHEAMPTVGKRSARNGWVLSSILGLLAILLALRPWFGPATDFQPPRTETLTYGGREWGPAASPAGDLVIFTSDRDGVPRIWMKQLAGGAEVPLTTGPDEGARFSPDGSQFLFTRDSEDSRQLYRQAVVGGQLRKILDDALEGDWSPDGQQVAFLRGQLEREDNSVLVGIAQVQTGQERILATIERRACYGIRWSTDGRHITVNTTSLTGNVAEASGIMLVDAATGETEFLAPTDWTGPVSCLEWLPDGQGFLMGQSSDVIAHVSGSPSLVMEYDLTSQSLRPLVWVPLRLPKGSWGSSSIALLGPDEMVVDKQTDFTQMLAYTLTDDGMGEPEILSSGLSIDRQPVFSPDGRLVLFSSNRSGNVDLWTLDLATRQTLRLTDHPAGDWDPAFSPNGQSVIWSSDRAGHMEIWMASVDGSGARQVTQDGLDAENPTMTPDEQWIIYASANDAKRGVWKIRPDGTEATQLTVGSHLLPEASPDGRFALFTFMSRLDSFVKVVEIETGHILDYTLDLNVTERDENLVFGRARWSSDGKGIYYIGQDEKGNSGVFLAPFNAHGEWDGQRRKVGGFDPRFTTESLGISPGDGLLVIGALNERRTLLRVSHEPLLLPEN